MVQLLSELPVIADRIYRKIYRVINSLNRFLAFVNFFVTLN